MSLKELSTSQIFKETVVLRCGIHLFFTMANICWFPIFLTRLAATVQLTPQVTASGWRAPPVAWRQWRPHVPLHFEPSLVSKAMDKQKEMTNNGNPICINKHGHYWWLCSSKCMPASRAQWCSSNLVRIDSLRTLGDGKPMEASSWSFFAASLEFSRAPWTPPK